MFAKTDENKTPWNAQVLVLGCCVVLPFLIGLWQDRNPLLAFGWIGVAYVFFMLIPYTTDVRREHLLPPALAAARSTG